MKTVAEVIGVFRSNLESRSTPATGRRTGVQDQGGCRRAADLWLSAGPRRSQAAGAGCRSTTAQSQVYRVMKVHGLLLDRHVGADERRHDGRVAVDERNRRWCSDGFEIGCDNGERVRVAFALDCCDREAMSFLATTGGIAGEDVRDLMVAAVEYRFGLVNRLPVTIEWLSDSYGLKMMWCDIFAKRLTSQNTRWSQTNSAPSLLLFGHVPRCWLASSMREMPARRQTSSRWGLPVPRSHAAERR